MSENDFRMCHSSLGIGQSGKRLEFDYFYFLKQLRKKVGNKYFKHPSVRRNKSFKSYAGLF